LVFYSLCRRYKSSSTENYGALETIRVFPHFSLPKEQKVTLALFEEYRRRVHKLFILEVESQRVRFTQNLGKFSRWQIFSSIYLVPNPIWCIHVRVRIKRTTEYVQLSLRH